MGAVLIVLAILAFVAVVQAAIWIPVTRSWRKKHAVFAEEFQAEVAASGEQVLVGPEPAVYRGSTGSYSGISGNGVIILTDRRLLFRKRSGGLVEVPRDQITGTRRSASFRSSRVGGQTHLVVATRDHGEVGFFVGDLDAWEAALGGPQPV